MNIPDEEKSFNLMVTYVAALIVVTTMAVVPVFLIYGNYRTKCDMPNFLMALEDPYLRHKVEIARRCPDRPLRLNPKKMKNYSFRSKRFTSFDTNPWLNQKPTVICKNCKWIIKRNVVNSIEGLFN
ncbi:hypothetical protein BDFB_014416 [Asbolus verrucosus]|uniref:Uncharacterized protein n=1 Tax=Asbolus verrucosus TaxID=1661398 RepID=A0A482V7A9_ASBVE|nr:hypothetical protein BDFB_014416 [Asbolus verrucosus]